MGLYSVTCRCGHVGNRNYIPITFAINAPDILTAQRKALCIPRVKHDNALAIINSSPITPETYSEIQKCNLSDPYLNARSKKETKKKEIMERVVYHSKNKNPIDRRAEIETRDPKRRIRFYDDFNDEFYGLESVSIINYNINRLL